MAYTKTNWVDNLTVVAAAPMNNLENAAFAADASITTLSSGKQDVSAKGAANGYASLDASAKVPVAQLPISYGTTLPASPVDGQEAVLVDSLTAPTYQWRFRYNAGSASAYKWEYIGGSPVTVIANADSAVSGGTTSLWNVTVDAAPAFVVTRAGDYLVAYAARASSAAAGQVQAGIANASLAPAAIDPAAVVNLTGGTYAQLAGTTRIAGVAAGHTLRMHIYTSVASGALGARIMAVTPVRVS